MSDTQQIQRYLDQLAEPSDDVPRPLPAKRFKIDDTLRVNRTMGLRLAGSGGQNRSPSQGWDNHRLGTILDWHGPAGVPMLELTGCSGFVLQGINFIGDASAGVHIRHGVGSLNYAIRDCGFVGLACGIQWGDQPQGHTCANCTYDNCHFEQCTTGVRLTNNQSLNHLFVRPNFSWGEYSVHVQQGGNVQMLAPHCNEMQSLLHLGNVGSNSRGFLIDLARFDGRNTRTNWVSFEDPTELRTYGEIVFRGAAQNNGQTHNALPLIQVAPGSRVILDACGFHAEETLRHGDLAHIYSERRADGQLIVRDSSGFKLLDQLADYVTLHGPRAYYEFTRCRGHWGGDGNASNFPGSEVPDGDGLPSGLAELLAQKEWLLRAAETEAALDNGRLSLQIRGKDIASG